MTPHAMTTHLTPEELIDSRERQLAPARQAHADDCAVCRAELARLEEVVLDVATVDVPEPSPLFWDHLSARIRDRVAHEPPPTAGRERPLARLTDWLTGWSSAPRWGLIVWRCSAPRPLRQPRLVRVVRIAGRRWPSQPCTPDGR